MSLRNFSALTKGDIIPISYNSQVYEIAVLEVKAHGADVEADAVCVVETDIEVDFAAPVGYVEPAEQQSRTNASSAASSRPESRMTGGAGTPGLPSDAVVVHGGMATKLNFHALSTPADPSSESAFSKAGQTLRGKLLASSPLAKLPVSQNDVQSISSVRTTKSFLEGGPVPKPFKVGFGCFFVGYPIVPVKKEGEEDVEVSENFKGAGVRLKDATKTKKRGRKDKNNNSGSGSKGVIHID